MEPGPIEAGVYSSRPLAPLPDVVSDALGAPSRGEVLRGLELAPLWRRTALRGRLVEAFGDHARRCGAGRIVAGEPGILPLASSVADRQGLPLEPPPEADDGRPGQPGRSPYLVARVLHEREEGRRFSGGGQPSDSMAGAGVLFRIRSVTGDDTNGYNVMFIKDL